MNKVIYVGFDTEAKAYEGDRVLRDMHREGTLTLYNDAVVVKEADGTVAVREHPEGEPIATVGGMLTGGLIGLLGGPIGAAMGMGTGTLIGAAFDISREGLDHDFVEDVAAHLVAPGKAAVIAEVEESWQVPLDTRMEALGGTVIRKTPTEIEDLYFEREIEASQRDLTMLQAEKLAEVTAAATKKSAAKAAKLQAKIDAAKRKVAEQERALAAKLQSVNEEGHERVALLEAQRKTASAESKAALERRLAEVRIEYQRRGENLKQVLERRKAAQATA
jgi:uncharacterized membrane protein